MQRDYGVIDRDRFRTLSGLEFLRGIISGAVPSPPISEVLDFHITAADPGLVVFEATPTVSTYNPAGSVHGGFTATLLDSCMTCAVQSTLAAGQGCTTLEFKINFVRPLIERVGLVRAEGRLIHAGRRQATAEGDLKDASGKLYAHATTTCLIFDA